MEAKDTVIKEILATHGYTVEEAESILNNAGRAIYQAGIREVVEWLEQYAIHGGEIPLSTILIDLKAHSPYGKPSSRNGG